MEIERENEKLQEFAKHSYYFILARTIEGNKKERIAESTNLLAILQTAIDHLSDANLKALVLVTSLGKVKYYWKKVNGEIKLVERFGEKLI